jgi:hypothetical protein
MTVKTNIVKNYNFVKDEGNRKKESELGDVVGFHGQISRK